LLPVSVVEMIKAALRGPCLLQGLGRHAQ
jgi:hypothetical protein